MDKYFIEPLNNLNYYFNIQGRIKSNIIWKANWLIKLFSTYLEKRF